jgi:hypothetical protein
LIRLQNFKINNNGNKMQGKYIVWIILAVIATMSSISVYTHFSTQHQLSPVVLSKLIQPYKEYIKNGEYEKAYNELTSEDYRAKFTFAQYKLHQDSNKVVFGDLVELKPVSGVFLKETTKESKIIFKATFGYIGSKKQQRILLDITREKGKYKIDNSYNSYLSMGTMMSVIY